MESFGAAARSFRSKRIVFRTGIDREVWDFWFHSLPIFFSGGKQFNQLMGQRRLEEKVVELLRKGESSQEVIKKLEDIGYSELRIEKAVEDIRGKMENSESRGVVEKEPEEVEETKEVEESKSMFLAISLAIFFPPIAYLYFRNYKLAIINILTVNYLGLGFFIVPYHCYKSINEQN